MREGLWSDQFLRQILVTNTPYHTQALGSRIRHVFQNGFCFRQEQHFFDVIDSGAFEVEMSRERDFLCVFLENLSER
jgi:hypothetical protein